MHDRDIAHVALERSQLLQHILRMLPGEARKVGEPVGIRTMTACAGRHSLGCDTVLKYLTSTCNVGCVATTGQLRSLLRIVLRQCIDGSVV